MAREVGPTLGYQVVEDQPEGILLRSSEFYGKEIDQYCIYPIINAKTGDRMHTFTSWQIEMIRQSTVYHNRRAAGVVAVEIVKEDRALRAKTYCRAFTELNVQLAESTGVHERELLKALGAALPPGVQP